MPQWYQSLKKLFYNKGQGEFNKFNDLDAIFIRLC